MYLLRQFLLFTPILLAASQKCYVGPNEEYRGNGDLVPCATGGDSACCLRGDICLSGNACWDLKTGNTYQYGCTDVDYRSESCPYKCGWNSTRSPWVGLEICNDVDGVEDTWICLAPESCGGCNWTANWDLLNLTARGCKKMGDDARVALYAPTALAPYVFLPSSANGSTGYFKPTTISGSIVTWNSIALRGYTPATVTPLTSYSMPTRRVLAAASRNDSTSSQTINTSSSSSSRASSSASVTASTSSAPSQAAATSSASTSSSLSSSRPSPDIVLGHGLGVIVSICFGVSLLGMFIF